RYHRAIAPAELLPDCYDHEIQATRRNAFDKKRGSDAPRKNQKYRSGRRITSPGKTGTEGSSSYSLSSGWPKRWIITLEWLALYVDPPATAKALTTFSPLR